MELKILAEHFSICKIKQLNAIDWESSYVFVSKTDEEISLVCTERDTPADCISVEPGYRGFRIEGILDFSLIGILAEITGLLAKYTISVFVISTYNTDYVFVKEPEFDKTLAILKEHGYSGI